MFGYAFMATDSHQSHWSMIYVKVSGLFQSQVEALDPLSVLNNIKMNFNTERKILQENLYRHFYPHATQSFSN